MAFNGYSGNWLQPGANIGVPNQHAPAGVQTQWLSVNNRPPQAVHVTDGAIQGLGPLAVAPGTVGKPMWNHEAASSGAVVNSVDVAGGQQVQAFTLAHRALMQEGTVPLAAGHHCPPIHPGGHNGIQLGVPGANPLGAVGVAGNVAYSFTVTAHIIHLRGQLTRAGLVQGGAGVQGPYGQPGHTPASLWMQENYQAFNLLAAGNNNVLIRDVSFRLVFELPGNQIFDRTNLQRAIDAHLQAVAVNPNYFGVCNVSVDLYNGVTGIGPINVRQGNSITQCRVQDGQSGICWLDAICNQLDSVNARGHKSVSAKPALIANQMRQLLAEDKGTEEADKWNPREEGIECRLLIKWAETFEETWGVSIVIADLLGFVFARHTCQLRNHHRTTRLFLRLVSPTHVEVVPPSASTRRAVVTDDMLSATTSSAPPQFDEETTLVLRFSCEADLPQVARDAIIPEGTKVVQLVWTNEDMDATPVTHIGGLLTAATQDAQSRDAIYVPEQLWFRSPTVACGTDDVYGLSPYRGCVWLLDNDYDRKVHAKQQVVAHQTDLGLSFSPRTLDIGYNSLAGFTRNLILSVVGEIPKSRLNPTVRAIMLATKCQHWIHTFKAINSEKLAMSVCEVDVRKCYSSVLMYNPFPFPVYSLLDDYEVFEPGTQSDLFILRRWATLSLANPGRLVYGTLPAASWIIPTAINVKGWPVPLTDMVYSTVMVDFLLKNDVIKPESIYAVCVASRTLRPDIFKSVAMMMFKLFPGDTGRLAGSALNKFAGFLGMDHSDRHHAGFTDSLEYAKLMFNSHYGKGRNTCVHVSPLTPPSDEAKAEEDPSAVYAVRFAERRNLTSMHLPLYQHVVDMGKLQLLKLALKLDMPMFGACVDGLIVSKQHVRAKGLYDSAYVVDPSDVGALPPPLEDLSFTVKPMVPAATIRFGSEPKPIDEGEWQLYARDLTEKLHGFTTHKTSGQFLLDDIKTKSDERTGAFVCGAGGSGKSHLMSDIYSAYQDAYGDGSVLVCTQTGLLVNNEFVSKWGIQDARTFAYLLTLSRENSIVFHQKYKKLKAILIDEAFRMTVPFVDLVQRMQDKNPSMAVFCFGDDHQTMGFDETTNPDGTTQTEKVPNYMNSSLIQGLCDYVKVDLPVRVEYSRFKNQRTFEAVRHFRETGKLLLGCFNLAPLDLSKERVGKVLTFTRNAQAHYNKLQQALFIAETGCTTISYSRDPQHRSGVFANNQPICTTSSFTAKMVQDAELWEDNPHPTVYNGEEGTLLIEVDEADPSCWGDIFFLRPTLPELRLTEDELYTYFDHAFAYTVYRFQGRAVKGRYAIVEANRMRRPELYTALSRCEDHVDVHVQAMLAPRATPLAQRTWAPRDERRQAKREAKQIEEPGPVWVDFVHMRNSVRNQSLVIGVTRACGEDDDQDLMQTLMIDPSPCLEAGKMPFVDTTDPATKLRLAQVQEEWMDDWDIEGAIENCVHVRGDYEADLTLIHYIRKMQKQWPDDEWLNVDMLSGAGAFATTKTGEKVPLFAPTPEYAAEVPKQAQDPQPMLDAEVAALVQASAQVVKPSSRKKFGSSVRAAVFKKGAMAGNVRLVFQYPERGGDGLLKRTQVQQMLFKRDDEDTAAHRWEKAVDTLVGCEEADRLCIVVRKNTAEWRQKMSNVLRKAFLDVYPGEFHHRFTSPQLPLGGEDASSAMDAALFE